MRQGALTKEMRLAVTIHEAVSPGDLIAVGDMIPPWIVTPYQEMRVKSGKVKKKKNVICRHFFFTLMLTFIVETKHGHLFASFWNIDWIGIYSTYGN